MGFHLLIRTMHKGNLIRIDVPQCPHNHQAVQHVKINNYSTFMLLEYLFST